MTDHTHIDLCPDCQGLRVTELTSLGVLDVALNGYSGPAEVFIGPALQPCDAVKTSQPVTLAREIAIDWGLADPDSPPPQTPIQRALDILRPHLAWDHRYRP